MYEEMLVEIEWALHERLYSTIKDDVIHAAHDEVQCHQLAHPQ